MSEPTFDPISRNGFEAIAYNAVGRASEVNNFPAYGLSHSTGNSGWSVGFMQWDFGQSGRGAAAADMLAGYQAWAEKEHRFTDAEAASLTTRLQTRGQQGNDLSRIEQARLNDYLRSDAGRAFVQTLDAQQLERKWANVGEPLSEVEWLRERSTANPRETVEIVAMASKLFNQNEVRGGRLLDRLAQGPMSSDEVRDWIGSDGVRGLTPAATAAITSGRDKAIEGAGLLGDAAFGRSRVADMFRDEVITRNNPSLSAGYSESVGSQLLDAAFRDPDRGRQLLQQIEQSQQEFSPLTMGGTTEVARVRLSASGELTVSPAGSNSTTLDANTLRPSPWPDVPAVDASIHAEQPGPRLTTTPLGMPMDVAERAGAVQHHFLEAPPLSQARDLRDPSHPGHAAFNEMVHRVRVFESQQGIPSGPHTEKLGAAVLQVAVENKVGYQDVFFERDAASGRIDLVNRRDIHAADPPRIALDMAKLSSQPIEVSSQSVNEAVSRHYAPAERTQVQARTPEQAQALSGLSFDDQVMFGRLRRDVPGHIGDGHVLQAMAEAKRSDIPNAASVGGVMMLGDRIRVMGAGEGAPSASVDVSQPAPKPEASLAAIQQQNQQHALEQQVAQQQTQQQSSAMRMA